jgi:hypothetical protein
MRRIDVARRQEIASGYRVKDDDGDRKAMAGDVACAFTKDNPGAVDDPHYNSEISPIAKVAAVIAGPM